MTRMWRAAGRMVLGAALAAAGLGGLGGCVSQKAYDDLHNTNIVLKNRNSELQNSLEQCEATTGALMRERDQLDATVAELNRQNQVLAQQLNLTQDDLARIGTQLGNMRLTALDRDTDAALAALASQYPDLIQYDPERGVLWFAADLTFDSGSDVVKPAVKSALQRLGTILKTPAASGYDVTVIGHTDSQPISAPTAARHPTNMHLAVHRAIAVIADLKAQGVEPNRMEAAGWGEYRPLVQNSANGNTPQNRRVEIALAAPKSPRSNVASAPVNTPGRSTQVDPTK